MDTNSCNVFIVEVAQQTIEMDTNCCNVFVVEAAVDQ